jgi:hypothetical protein
MHCPVENVLLTMIGTSPTNRLPSTNNEFSDVSIDKLLGSVDDN